MAFLEYIYDWGKEEGQREGAAEGPRVWPVWEVVDCNSHQFLLWRVGLQEKKFIPLDPLSSPLGLLISLALELCNFYQGHRKQSKARSLLIARSVLIAFQYETLPVVPEPLSAICQSQECPFLHLFCLHLKYIYKVTASLLSFVFQNWLPEGNEKIF